MNQNSALEATSNDRSFSIAGIILYKHFAASLIFFALCLNPLNSIKAQELQSQQNLEGRIEFQEKSYDFGAVAEGQVIEKEFKFKNTGNSDLKILRVASTCGCTAAASTTDAIAASGEGSVKVSFDSDGFSGKVSKIVRVYTTDGQNPEITLRLEGIVDRSVELNPAKITFTNVVAGQEAKQQLLEIKLKNPSGKTVKSVKSFSKFISIKQQNAYSDNNFFVYPYLVELSPDITEGLLRERLLVEISDGSKSIFHNVPVLGQIEGSISVEPKQISFGMISPGPLLSRTIKIQSRTDKAIEIQDITSDIPALEIEQKTIEPGKIYVLNVRLDPLKIKSDFRGLIKVRISDQNKAELLISVFGIVPPKKDY